MGDLVGAHVSLFNVHKYSVSVYYTWPRSGPDTQREQDRACLNRLAQSSVSESDKPSLQSGPVNLPNLSSRLACRYCKLRQLVQGTVTDTQGHIGQLQLPCQHP